MSWLKKFASRAKNTDNFVNHPHHAAFLAAGLMGEAGSVLTELKKSARERNAYPIYRKKMFEEIGDFLWYCVRLADLANSNLLQDLEEMLDYKGAKASASDVNAYLDFGSSIGAVLERINKSESISDDQEFASALKRVWKNLIKVAAEAEVSLELAADQNLKKIESRWPTEKKYHGLFDNDVAEEEQLPRKLEIQFLERDHGRKTVFLRCNGLNFGDRLTDNIQDPDGYRYHDVFHFAYAVYLGWSPVVRALLKVKRKSKTETDEAQDGARAIIVEEAVSASVFSRAKLLSHFDGIEQVDYDLLKTIQEFVKGFEVEKVPLWQWEKAILEGNRLFRLLQRNKGGTIRWDLNTREMHYTAP